MFHTYILHSPRIDRFYIGCTSNIEERLKKHNNKNRGFTNQSNDWVVVFYRSFDTKNEALELEKQIKSWKSKIRIRKLINSEHPDA
jgi:putative endonuclease